MAGKFDTVTYTPGGVGPKTIVVVILAIILLLMIYWLSPFGTIPAGERGII
jgi:hypothetical protein